MCENCRECLLKDEHVDLTPESRNTLKSIIINLNNPAAVEILFADGTTVKGNIEFNDNRKIIFSSVDESDFLCNIMEYATDVMKL